MPSSGASSQPPRCQKSRRRRRRKAARAANQNSASRQADLTTPAAQSTNRNSAHWRATQPRSAANDRPEMRSTSVEHPHSFTSSPLTQLPIPTDNQNSGSTSHHDHSEIWGLYKPAQTSPETGFDCPSAAANHRWKNPLRQRETALLCRCESSAADRKTERDGVAPLVYVYQFWAYPYLFGSNPRYIVLK